MGRLIDTDLQRTRTAFMKTVRVLCGTLTYRIDGPLAIQGCGLLVR